MQTMTTIYNLLGVNRKIKEDILRIRYLREIWGLDQTGIAECEGISQSQISKRLQETKLFNYVEWFNTIEYEASEIEILQRLPRDMLADIPLIAFVNNVLGLNPNHSFYTGFTANTNIRIAALSSLGIQNKYLEKRFNKSQANTSMVIKRNIERALNIERYQRYELQFPLTFSSLEFGGKAYVD